MKKLALKIFSVIIVCTILISCAGLSENPSNEKDKEITSEKEKTNEDSANKSSIVIYFSCTGSTEKVAHNIADNLVADIYSIVPKEEYTLEDLDYGDSSSKTSIEQNDENVRPEIKSEKLDLSKYNNIFIGYPIWWEKAPRIITTFIESYDFSGKNVIPFCTSGSSSIDGSVSELKEKYPSINWKDGKRLAVDTSKDEISSWLSNLNMK